MGLAALDVLRMKLRQARQARQGCRAGRCRDAVPPGVRARRGGRDSLGWASMPSGCSGHFQRASVFLGGLGPTAGTWSGVGAARRRAAARGACVTRQLRAVAPAVPCYACHACVVRRGFAGSASLSCYACPARRDQSPGVPLPRQPPAVSIRWLSAIQGCAPAGHGRPTEPAPRTPSEARPEIAVRPPTAPGPESGETCSPTDRGTRSRSRTGAPPGPRRTRRRGSSAARSRPRRPRW